MARWIWVVVLASVGAVCEMVVVIAAAGELRELARRRKSFEPPTDKHLQVLDRLSTNKAGVSDFMIGRVLDELKHQWTPRRSTIRITQVVAPFGIIAGLAAALIAAVP